MKKATTYQSELIIKANIDLPYEEHLNHILQITHKVKKILPVICLIFLTFQSTWVISQDNPIDYTKSNTYVEVGGTYFLGASINYEYRLGIFKILSFNPGISLGFSLSAADSDSEKSVNYLPLPNAKLLIGKNIHFVEFGVSMLGNPIQGFVGYRFNAAKNPLFYRVTFYKADLSPRTGWIGLSLGYRFKKKT
ncbi:MAG: hypothetical protein R2759_12030 [Bacteroidales bacterium]